MGYITLNVKGLPSEFDSNSNGHPIPEEVNECAENSIEVMQIPEQSIILENCNNEEIIVDPIQQLQSTNMEITGGPSILKAGASTVRQLATADLPTKGFFMVHLVDYIKLMFPFITVEYMVSKVIERKKTQDIICRKFPKIR